MRVSMIHIATKGPPAAVYSVFSQTPPALNLCFSSEYHHLPPARLPACQKNPAPSLKKDHNFRSQYAIDSDRWAPHNASIRLYTVNTNGRNGHDFPGVMEDAERAEREEQEEEERMEKRRGKEKRRKGISGFSFHFDLFFFLFLLLTAAGELRAFP